MENLETTETLAPEAEGGTETLGVAMPGKPEEKGFGSPLGGDGNPFSAGDLVWGRIKGHNWWPGRVCDQSQLAYRGNKPYRSVPVSYFGDGAVSWCNPSQLKPFVENFHQMAGSSQSKSFVEALESVLGEIGRCLEVQMVCYCVPEKERNEFEKYFSMNPGVSNYSEREFLDLVKNVAVDLSVIDLLEITRLRSRVVAYERGCSYADPSVCHRRKGIKELVDKIDLDVPPADLVEEREEEERVEMSLLPNERSRCSKRSMAVLIAEMDLDMDHMVDVGSRMGENGTAKEEDTGPRRRERKKSKYLSPPYTYLDGGISKLLASADSSETKSPKSSRAEVTRSSSAIQKCDAEETWREEDEKSSPLCKFDNVAVDEILHEFLVTAINPLYLKCNRAARTVTRFFAKHRSSMYSSGAEFVAYQKRVTESVSVNMEIVNSEVDDKSKEGEKSKERRGRREYKANGDSKGPLESGLQATDQFVKKDRTVAKGKMVKEGANGETPMSSKVKLVTVCGGGNSENKKEKRKGEGNHESRVHLGGKPLDIVESGKKRKKSNSGKEVAPLEVNGGDKIDSKEANSSQEKKSNEGGKIPIEMVKKTKKALKEQKAGDGFKSLKDSTWKVYSAALLLNFSQGINLPSREDLISVYSKYGNLIESEVEMLKESSSARVVFVRCTDAEKAFNDKAGPFGPPVASYRLHYLAGNPNYPPVMEPSLPALKPPLPYIRKSLERMISTLNGTTTSPENNLVGEMQGLLTKVNQMLSGPADGTFP